MPRYNLRTLRGERVIKKKEGDRLKRWESSYKRLIKNARNLLSLEEVLEEIEQTFENNAVEQEKVSLICPCFDLKGFLAMKTKINFLNCPICNIAVDNELDGLCIDKYFQNILSDVSDGTEIEILGDGTFRMVPLHSAPIIPKVIDDEEPCASNHSPTLTYEVKSEVDSDGDDIENLGSVSSFDNDGETKESNAETQVLHLSDTSMTGDINQAAHSSNAKYSRCSYSTNNGGSLHKHSLTHSGEKPYKCDKCSFANAQSSALKIHMRYHTGERPYKCNKCSYAGAQLSNLKKHMRTHTGEKPHKCRQCSYASAQAKNLANHIRTHTGEKPYNCKHCSFACVVSSDLKKHMRTHTGEKPYKCDQCTYACGDSSCMRNHIRIHTGEKPYKCDQCSFACNQSSALKRHMHTHTGEKPYTCNLCSYASARFSTLNTHMRTHTDEKPFKCIQCSYACADRSALGKHMRTHV